MQIKTAYRGFGMRTLIGAFVIALATSAATLAQTPSPAAYRAEEPANRSLDATFYMQIAAEYRAACYQAYALATARLGRMVQDATAQPEQKKKRAIIMDLDETVLDNSHFQAMLLKNGLTWTKPLWNTWEEDYSADVGLVPGAKEFIKKATDDWHVEVFYVSNRSERFRQSTLDALKRLDILPKDDAHLKLAAYPELEDGNNKTGRFDEVRANYDVLLYVGDSLRDFDNSLRFEKLASDASGPDLDEAIAKRQDAVDKVKDNFGRAWIILPNPTYGEWKGPLGRGQKDFERLRAANFPIPPASAAPSASVAPPDSPASSDPKAWFRGLFRHRHIDPAIWAAVIAFVSAAFLFFWRKSSERRSINRAILAEIRRLLAAVERHRTCWLKKIADGDTNYPLVPFSHAVYSKQVANVGALKSRRVAKVVTFYGYLDFINSLQQTRPLYGAQKTDEFNREYLEVVTNLLNDYKKVFGKR